MNESKAIIRTKNVSFTLDVENSTSSDNNSTLTDYPSPAGTEYSDHIYRNRRAFTLTGEIGNIFCNGNDLYDSEDRAERIINLLNTIKDNAEPVTVLTKVESLKNMLITGINSSTGDEGANTLIVTITFEELIVSKIRTTTIDTEAYKTVEDGVKGSEYVDTSGDEVDTDEKTSIAEVAGTVANTALIGAGIGLGAVKIGALVGSTVAPGVGTAVGAAIGGVVGIVGCIAENIVKNRGDENE